MTDKEILDDIDYFEKMEELRSNQQCYWCGGWYLYCQCNLRKDREKVDFQRYTELRNIG